MLLRCCAQGMCWIHVNGITASFGWAEELLAGTGYRVSQIFFWELSYCDCDLCGSFSWFHFKEIQNLSAWQLISTCMIRS
ncbi:hypothetical protein KC19_8G046300 [Ceratodon purpureus]|uniref:Uncharacterized protein n=1 Tax=Ceratodon purpureus TaxID=3225 RepID=A0A8T0GYU6_CERPU|nr:hypothetical protein KC19_8G046300 [Ceratodon purpureus]